MAKFEKDETRLEFENEKVEATTGAHNGTMNIMEKFLSLIDRFGIRKIFEAMLLVVLFVFLTIFAFKPESVFNAYDKYKETQHNERMVERLDNTPLIQETIDEYRNKVGASRVAVFELHNSTNSLEGMPFLFASMTYESINPALESAAKEYDNVRLSLHPIISYLRDNEVWYGKIEDLVELDHIAYQRLRVIEAKYVGFKLLETDRVPTALVVTIFNEGSNIQNLKYVKEESFMMTYKVNALLSVKKKKK